MTSVAEKYEWMPQTRYLGPARVLEVDDPGRRARLRLTGYPQEGSAWARIAISGHHSLKPGDLALVVGEELSDLYLIGVLNRENALDAPERKIALSGGTQAEAAGRPEEQTLRVFSPKQELLFEYDEKNGRARVNMEAGDLEFVTQNGSITFASSREILFHGRSIGLTSTRGVCLGVMDTLGKLRSTLTLRQQGVKMDSSEIGIDAERGEFNVEEAKYTGKRLLSKVDRLETIAGSVIAKARNIYQTVEELSQVRAGRMRTMVARTFHFKSKKAFVKAEEDYKIKAEKIHLG